MSPIHVTSLHVYPLKSGRGIAVPSARLGPRGLERDRELLVVDARGRFLTQREHPRLALIDARPERLAGVEPCRWTFQAPGLPALELAATDAGPRVPATIWKDTTPAVDQGDAAAAWLSSALALPGLRLVRMAQDHVRACNPAWAKRPGAQTGFADAYPALLASTSSLDDVSARLGRAVPMDRFRANVVVSGAPAWAEDGWTRLRIGGGHGGQSMGGLELDVVKPCERCGVPSIDQQTAERTKEPGATLARFRVHDGSRWPTLDGKILFGQNLVHHAEGVVSVGDEVVVLG